MSGPDKHLLVCSPVPPGDSELKSWGQAIRDVADMIRSGNDSPWQMGDMLARVALAGRLGSDTLGTHVAGVVATTGPQEWQVRNGLIGAVCAMSAAIQQMGSRRLTANAERRDLIAVTLWSALSFRPPLAEPTLERLRQELLDSARGAALRKAMEDRSRTPVEGRGRGAAQGNRALRTNADLDREEIDLLRWMLADQSTLLGGDYKDVADTESGVLARGLEVGLMVRRLPSFEHYELASRDLPPGEDLSLSELLERLGEDRELLAKPFRGSSVVEQCPAGFPLLTALGAGAAGRSARAVERTRADWCGRALLESAVVKLAEGSDGADL